MDLDLAGSETFHPSEYVSQDVQIPIGDSSLWSELPKDLPPPPQPDYLYPPHISYDSLVAYRPRRRSEGYDDRQPHPQQRHHSKSMSTFIPRDGIPESINPLEAAGFAYASQLSQMQQHSTNGSFHNPDQWNPSFCVEQRRPPTFNASTGTSVPLPSVNRDGTGILNSSVTVTSHAMRTAANNRTKREARYQCQYCSDLLTTSAGLRSMFCLLVGLTIYSLYHLI
jgi:hypothetical protein